MTKDRIVLYDGDCALCSRSVYRIYKLDKNHLIYFASLQSDTGQKLLKKCGLAHDYTDSIVFIDKDKHWIKSTAALKMLPYFKWYMAIFNLFYIIPRSLRDMVYDWIADNRHSLVKEQSCRLGDEAFRKQILS